MVVVSSSAVQPSEVSHSSEHGSGATGSGATGSGATTRPGHWLAADVVPPLSEGELARETLRVNLRYQQELIEAFNLCPWAKGARTSDNAVPRVDDGRPLLRQVADAAALAADVAFLILPTYIGSRLDFDELVAQLIAEDARQHRESSPPFAMAAFHPEAAPQTNDGLSPETLVPYLRRSPDPTIQLVRLEALARVRKGEPLGTSFLDPAQIDFATLLSTGMAPRPSLRQRVGNANHAVFAGAEGADLRRVLEDILTDRKLTHQRLGLPPSPWES